MWLPCKAPMSRRRSLDHTFLDIVVVVFVVGLLCYVDRGGLSFRSSGFVLVL